MVDLHTSLLTPTGYKFRHQLEVGDVIVNYNTETNKWEHDTIQEFYDVKYDGPMYTFLGKGFEFRCSEGHWIIYEYRNRYREDWTDKWDTIVAKVLYEKFRLKNYHLYSDFRFPGFPGVIQPDYDISDDLLEFLGALFNKSFLVVNGVLVADVKEYYPEKLGLKYFSMGGNLHIDFNPLDYFTYDANRFWKFKPFIYQLSERQAGILLEAASDRDFEHLIHAKQIVHIAHLAGKVSYTRKVKGSFSVKTPKQKFKNKHINKVKVEYVEEDIWYVKTKNGTIITDQIGSFVSGAIL